ncbi:M-phase-specific PLK1-interacting protein [Rhipicephalus sanguineus]|uniref:M-phase-specific PLK1-interacting protein n=1 Tax=Rhipicephalus sanguineus TaxID=34632 RepID=UPI00189352B6|nr:M-phase-specific PLK1-interacting protein [Rhipicephalus sanguineus]
MQNESSPRDKRPLFAQGVIYPSPPASPYRSPNGGQQQQQPSYAPNFSSPSQTHSGSPYSSPRFSTPVYGHHPRQPKYPRESYGSPRSPWQQQGYHGYPSRQRFSSNRLSSGSRGSSWSGSPFQSPRDGASSGSKSYVKPSMVEDPWAELQDMLQVKKGQPGNASANTTTEESPAETAFDVNASQSDNSEQCTADTGSKPLAEEPELIADEKQCS